MVPQPLAQEHAVSNRHIGVFGGCLHKHSVRKSVPMNANAIKQMKTTLKTRRSNLGHCGEEGGSGRSPEDYRGDPPDRR